MSILADIAALEELTSAILARVATRTPADARVAVAAAEAILALLDASGVTAEDLATPEAQQQIAEALEAATADWGATLRQRLGDALRESIDAAERFYGSRGIRTTGLREAAARSTLARALRERLSDALRVIHRQLADATITAIEEQVLAGRIDRTALAERIERLTDTSTTFARVQAQAAVGALNQTYREAVAERAGLSFYHYYGTVMDSTRPFCRIHIGYVYERARILQMRNGMLEPVLTFKGGFNCRHAWLPVDPTWSDDLAARVVDAEPRELWLDAAGNRRITVVAPDGRVTRLIEQIKLQRLGYVRFYDAQDNDSGFVALHQDWARAHRTARAGSALRALLDQQFAAAVQQAAAGAVVRLEAPPGLTPQEEAALRSYTGFAFKSLNAALRDGVPLTPEQQALADDISNALAKLPPFRGTVWRGIGFRTDEAPQAAALEADLFDSFASGDPIGFLSFTSSSTDQDTAFAFGADRPMRFRLTILSRSGRAIKDYSQLPDEDEVLFDRETLFSILELARTPDAIIATLQEL